MICIVRNLSEPIQFVRKHKDEAEQLQIGFNKLRSKINDVSAAIIQAIAKERDEADRQIIAVRQHTTNFGADVEE
jgi:predicted transcriptional regulator